MTWTYVLAKLATTPLYQVRLMIGDTVGKLELLQDEEIEFYISQDPSIWRAAARCCRSIAGAFSTRRRPCKAKTENRVERAARATDSLAAQVHQRCRSARGLPRPGGISVFDKLQQELNPDRVVPQFNLGMDDNLVVPVGPVGNETQDSGNSEPVDA